MGLNNYCKICGTDAKRLYKKHLKEYKKRPEVVARRIELDRNRYKNDPAYREKRLKQNRDRRKKDPAKIKARLYDNFKKQTDVNYKLKKLLRSRVGMAIRRLKCLDVEVNKCSKTIDLLGCSVSDLKIYLENLFMVGMSWDNHGFGDDKWHIDHIKPCILFDLTQESEQRKCFHYTNLQPLWQKDNLSKGDSY